MNFKKSLLIALFSIGIAQSAFAETDSEKLVRAAQLVKQQNYAAAFPLFKQLAEQGYVKAQLNLGFMYDIGQGVAQNHKQAVYWYQKAAEQGDAKAHHVLGLSHLIGESIHFNKSKAKYHFGVACDNGYSDSCKQYADLEKQGVR